MRIKEVGLSGNYKAHGPCKVINIYNATESKEYLCVNTLRLYCSRLMYSKMALAKSPLPLGLACLSIGKYNGTLSFS